MKRLLIICQKVDEGDDLLGFFVDWLREFGKHADHVDVITLGRGAGALPENVHVYSLGKERGASKLSQLIRFYWLSVRLIPRCSAIFAHMSPIFVNASWPIAVVWRKKIILWYLHRSVTVRLWIAEKLVSKIVTASTESLRLKSSKIVEVGHGINVKKYQTQRTWTSGPFRVLSVGRISPIKDYETLLRGARGMEVTIVGRPVMPYDGPYFEKLKKIGGARFAGFIPHNRIVPYYQQADIVVSLSPTGGIDKSILEGMASGALVLTSNKVFMKYFGIYAKLLIFEHSNADDLAGKLTNLFALPKEEKQRLSAFLITSVATHHDIQRVVANILHNF